MNRRNLTLIMENKPGALARVVGLFHQRGYNIESLHVDSIEDISKYHFIQNIHCFSNFYFFFCTKTGFLACTRLL